MIARTDLAVELQEDKNWEIPMEGIRMKTRVDTEHHIKETKIVIENEAGSRQLGKPVGTYITLECHDLQENDFSYHDEMSTVLSEYLQLMLPHRKKILIAGLGNRNVTPDALGPYVIDHLFVTGHLQKHGYYKASRDIRAISPGVMAQTGMETGEILKAIIKETEAEVLIVIDALSARNSRRLNTTIQVSNTGILPGAGIGNHRKAINEQTMGVPVIAIGVPTVISISTILCDAVESLVEQDIITEEQQAQFIHDAFDDGMKKMFVTPKNIDEAVQRISFTVSEGINQWIIREENE